MTAGFASTVGSKEGPRQPRMASKARMLRSRASRKDGGEDCDDEGVFVVDSAKHRVVAFDAETLEATNRAPRA